MNLDNNWIRKLVHYVAHKVGAHPNQYHDYIM